MCTQENQRLNAELTKSKHRTVELLTRVTDLETVVLQKVRQIAAFMAKPCQISEGSSGLPASGNLALRYEV